MKTYLAAILFILLMQTNAMAHPVHVSVCNIEIEGSSFVVAMKLFQDDFRLALEHNFGKQVDLSLADSAPARELIDSYIKAMFTVSLNKKDTVRLEYRRTEINENAVWFYYEGKLPSAKELNIRNALLLDIYDDQTNLVIINCNGKQNGYRFNIRNYAQVIELKK